MGSGNSLHLVKWETIQKPLGGLGLKCMTDFNISLVAPNILKVLNKENIPWPGSPEIWQQPFAGWSQAGSDVLVLAEHLSLLS